MATACRAGLWLAFDCLDESRRISQELHTEEGSYWRVLAQMPITHAIPYLTVGQYLAL
jgi:hypothetical protein